MDKEVKLIIACEAFKNELAALTGVIEIEILWVPHSLHNEPEKLNLCIREKVAEAEQILCSGELVLIFLGNCGGAMVGVCSQSLYLTYPDVADCIPVIMGSMDKYLKLQKDRPGTFYLNKAWIDSGEDPLSSNRKYSCIYGEKKGWKISRLMYRNYTHFALIDNGCYDMAQYRDYVKTACTVFDKEYVEESGDLSFVKSILSGTSKMIYVSPTSLD